MTISKKSYGEYSSDNYGAHTVVIEVNGVEVYFSYKTVVAFRGPKGLRVIQNQWGPTTGKHLNWIDGGDKKGRLTAEQFQKEFSELQTEKQLLIDPRLAAGMVS